MLEEGWDERASQASDLDFIDCLDLTKEISTSISFSKYPPSSIIKTFQEKSFDCSTEYLPSLSGHGYLFTSFRISSVIIIRVIPSGIKSDWINPQQCFGDWF